MKTVIERTQPIKSAKLHQRLYHNRNESGHLGGYLKGHPLMRSETSHTHPRITGTICCMAGPSRSMNHRHEQPSQRAIMSPSAQSKSPNKNGSWNQDTPPSTHTIDEAMRILNQGTRENSNVTDGLTPGTMENVVLRDKHMTSLVIE